LSASLGSVFPTICIDTIPGVTFGADRDLLCFDDSWTLLAWVRTLRSHSPRPEAITILHADDHADLDLPHIIADQGDWYDAVTGMRIDLEDDRSIASAILSGAIGIGSFIVPLAHLVESLEIRHLRGADGASGSGVLYPDHVRYGDGGARVRLGLSREGSRSENRCAYAVTDDADTWCRGISPDSDVLLHIDMDYFDNRHGGTSWASTPASRAGLSGRLDRLVAALARHAVSAKCRSTTIALSPGFFPSTAWSWALPQICLELEQAGFSTPPWRK
jgi:hypothetical protein